MPRCASSPPTGTRPTLLCLALAFYSVPLRAEPSETTPAPAQQAAPAPSEAARVRARAAFMRGIELVEQGRFREAKDSFLEAHAEAPHALALYNAALACLELGERAEARRLLEQAISEPGGLSEEEVRMIRTKLESLRETLPEKSPPPEPPVSQEPRAAGATLAPPRSVLPTDVAARRAPLEPSDAGAESPLSAKRNTGYLVGGAGLTLLVASGILYVWNDHRYKDWQKTNQSLHSLEGDLANRGQVPTEDSGLRAKTADNDALIASIHTFDVVNLALLAAGVVGVGVGTWLSLDAKAPEPGVELAVGPRFRLGYRW